MHVLPALLVGLVFLSPGVARADVQGELLQAVREGEVEDVLRLLSQGARVDATDSTGETPLHYAATRGKTDIAELLIAHGADVNARDAMDQTPLHYAAIWIGGTEASQLLIAHGADVNARDKDGKTPLAMAEERINDDLSKLLRRHGGR